MSDIRLTEAGVPFQPCPACGQEVVPSHNGWARHQPYCPAHLAAIAVLPGHRPDSLDAAWAEAEAALPEGWGVVMIAKMGMLWTAAVGPVSPRARNSAIKERRLDVSRREAPSRAKREAQAETPAAALRAVAAKLHNR